LAYIRKERDVKYHQLLFDLLARQYEAARMDEAKSAPVIQVVDPALPPDRKSAPFRALWAIVGGTLGFLFSSWLRALVLCLSPPGGRRAAGPAAGLVEAGTQVTRLSTVRL
jgi:LPS O-antigen subunit length determinant protein (WzzB/FepE family)